MQVFDVDSGSFPKMTAKLLMLDSSFHSVARPNLTIYENNISRVVSSTYCPPAASSTALSSILALDASGSMSAGFPQKNIDIARSAAQFWINIQDFTKSECALTFFDANSYIACDFTKNKDILFRTILGFSSWNGANHYNALLSQPGGGIYVAVRGKYKRVIILITDGQSSIAAGEAISAAKNINASVYGIGLRVALTDSIKKIISETGGIYFDNITSENEILTACRAIYAVASGQNICKVEWLSSAECNAARQVEARDASLGTECKFSYTAPIFRQTHLTIKPGSVDFGEVSPWSYADTLLELRANNNDIFIRSIAFDNPFFSIPDNPAPFILKAGMAIRLRTRFSPVDKLFALGNLKIESDACSQDYTSILSGNTTSASGGENIRIIHPDGREKLFAGTDTAIRWTGTPSNKAVVFEVSSDGGVNWKKITDSATNYSFLWNIPEIASDHCLVKARMANSIDQPADTSFDLPMNAWNIRYSRSGNIVAVAGYTIAGNGRIRIYSAKQGERPLFGIPIDLPDEEISDVDISPDENYIAAFSRNTASIFIAKIADGTIGKYALPDQITGYAGIRFSPDGKYVAVGRHVFDVSAKQFVEPFENVENTGALSPDGRIMAASLAASERRLSLRDFNNRSEICRTPQHSFATSAPIYITTWSADAAVLASATANDNDIIVADTLCGLQSRIPAQINPTSNIALNPSGTILAAIYYGDTIKLWDTKGGTLIRSIKKRIINGSGVNVDFTAIAFSPDGRELAAGGNGHLIFIRLDTVYKYNYWQPIVSFNHGNNNRRGIEMHISPDGKQVLVLYEREQPDKPHSPTNSGLAEMWGVEPAVVKFTVPNVSALAYGRSGKYAVFAIDSASRSYIAVYDAITGQPAGRLLYISNKKITAVDISPNDSLAAIVSGDSVLLIRLGENPGILSVAPYKFNAPIRLTFIDNGAAIWLAENNGAQGQTFILHPDISTWDIRLQSVHQKQLIGGDASSGAMQYSVVTNDFLPVIEKIDDGIGFIAKNNVVNARYSTNGQFLIFPYNGIFDTLINGRNIKAAAALIYSRQGDLLQAIADTNSDYPIAYASFSNYGRRVSTLGYSSKNNRNNIVIWEGKPRNVTRSDTLFSIIAPKADFRNANFGETPAGTNKDTTFASTFFNGGSYPIYVSTISFDSPSDAEFSLVAGLPAEIPAHGSIPVELRFSPRKEGDYTAVAKFSTNMGEIKTILSGAASLTAPATPEVIDFGNVEVGTTKDSVIKSIIRNTGSRDIIVSQIMVRGPDSLHFKLIAGEEKFELKSGQSYGLTLRFTPEFIARTSARLEFIYAALNDSSKQYSSAIPLYGEGYYCDKAAAAVHIKTSEKIIRTETGKDIGIAIVASHMLDATGIRIKYKRSVLFPISNDAILFHADGAAGYLTIPTSNDYGGDTIVFVKFRVALGDSDSAVITVDSVLFNLCEFPVLSDSTLVLITDICRAGGSRLFDGAVGRAALAVLPNPIIDGTSSIAVRLIEKGLSKLELVDRLGHSLHTVFESEQETGERQIKADFEEILSGSYTLVLRTPNQIIALPIVIIR